MSNKGDTCGRPWSSSAEVHITRFSHFMVVFRCLKGLSWYETPGFCCLWGSCRALHISQTWSFALTSHWPVVHLIQTWVVVVGFSAWSADWGLLHIVTFNQFMNQFLPEQQKITLHNISSLVINGVSFDDIGIVQTGFHEFSFYSSVPFYVLFWFVLPHHLVQFVYSIHVLGIGSHSRRTGELCAIRLLPGDALWFFLMRGVGSRQVLNDVFILPCCCQHAGIFTMMPVTTTLRETLGFCIRFYNISRVPQMVWSHCPTQVGLLTHQVFHQNGWRVSYPWKLCGQRQSHEWAL